MTQEQMIAEIERLKTDNARLAVSAKSNNGHSLSCKVSEKGGLSVYGLGRFPVTLYKGQWISLIKSVPKIEEFIKANDSKLKDKAAAA